MIRPRYAALPVLLILLCIASSIFVLHAARAQWADLPLLPRKYIISTAHLDDWTAYGGTWELRQGAMHNNSDERGAKLISGSLQWSDYTLQSDIRFDADHGDMGIILRSNDEEEGVDSYNGYYIGLRTSDGTLLVGRSDYGWIEGRPILMPGGVHAANWYRLTVTAVGCDLVARSENLSTHESTGLRFSEHPCVRTGRIGLRSFSTGGSWRNLRVTRASGSDYLAAASGIRTLAYPEFPKSEAEYNRGFHFSSADAPAQSKRPNLPSGGDQVRHIGDLQSVPRNHPRHVSIRGVVTLTSPLLYVQDSSGSVLVRDSDAAVVNVGDAVEIQGTASPTLYGAQIFDAHVRDLWSGTPLPPISVTPLQASSGTYDGRFIQVEGHLLSTQHGPGQEQVLNLSEGGEVFRAVYRPPLNTMRKSLQPGSLLRLRGICVLDPAFTEERTPFALLPRSMDDIQILEGPPWWTPIHTVLVSLGVLALALLVQIAYFRLKQWQVLTVTQERERLAHDIHDTMAQSFAGIGYQIQGIRSNVLRSDPSAHGEIAEQLGVAYLLVRHCHEEASRTISMLASKPPTIETDLLSELKDIAEKIAGDQVRTSTEQIGTPQPLNLRLANALYHIGQEAVSNALAHSVPTLIRIVMEFTSSHVILTVSDNGQGFNESCQKSGFGILGMEKRAREVNAVFQIRSSPQNGTSLSVTASLPQTSLRSRWMARARLTIRHLRFDLLS